MKYRIYLTPESEDDLRRLTANVRAAVKDAIKAHLGFEPTKMSKSRIKRLRGMSQPQFRLRVDDYRVYYDVLEQEQEVEVLAVIHKSESDEWLARVGVKDERAASD